MAPKPITESDQSGQDTAVPPEIIAQAEAAVAGNARMSQRRPSQAKSSASRRQQDLRQTSNSSEQSKLTSDIKPNIDILVG
jgi:hypothetical protein